jgi:predicted nicotinamide N-methyase
MILPASPEELIDVSDFNVDERLPYWADLWPSARALAASLLELNDLPGRAIELGCGVGLPSLALKSRGVDVLATDWYDDALRFAELNADRNGLGPLQTMSLDWRRIPSIATGRFDLLIAADVLYEERNVPAVARAIEALLKPAGEALLADPGRSYLPAFLRQMESHWRVERLRDRRERPQVEGGVEMVIQLFKLSRKSSASHPASSL